MPKIQCFFLEPTDRGIRYLRRYVTSDLTGKGNKCPKTFVGYHEAYIPLEEVPIKIRSDGCQVETQQDVVPHNDSRWPKTCVCGRIFTSEDIWQIVDHCLYRRADSGATMILRDAPAGAMWYAPWMEDWIHGPDGHCLVVRTPVGEWMVDGPANNGPGWSRTGKPPKITARPSIGQLGDDKAFRYHGFLTDGVLEDI